MSCRLLTSTVGLLHAALGWYYSWQTTSPRTGLTMHVAMKLHFRGSCVSLRRNRTLLEQCRIHVKVTSTGSRETPATVVARTVLWTTWLLPFAGLNKIWEMFVSQDVRMKRAKRFPASRKGCLVVVQERYYQLVALSCTWPEPAAYHDHTWHIHIPPARNCWSYGGGEELFLIVHCSACRGWQAPCLGERVEEWYSENDTLDKNRQRAERLVEFG